MTERATAPPAEAGVTDEPEEGPGRRGGRLAAAVTGAAAVCLLVRTALPSGLDVRTDVVGYPVHRNFDVYSLFRTYYVAAVLFPLSALALYLVLGRFIPTWRAAARPERRGAGRPPPVDSPPGVDPTVKAAAGRLLFTGAVVGLELALILRARHFWLVGGAVAAVYAGLVTLAAVGLRRPLPRRSPAGRRAVANGLALAVIPFLLYEVSATSRVTVLADASVRHHPWMPLWLAAAGSAAVLCFVARALARASRDEDVLRVERRAVLVVAGAAGLFLVIARLPGGIGGLDFFHDGEHLVGADLVSNGAFPWRDVLFVHGLIEDVVHAGVGMWVFGNDVWGALAGLTVLVGPLYWVGLYLLQVHLFGRNWLFLVLTATLLLQGWLTPELNRLILVPYLLLLLSALLRRATPGRAAGFVVVGLATTIVTPESALAVLAGGMAVVAFEVWYGEPGQPVARRFRRSLWCAAWSVTFGAAWCFYLALNGALGSFLFSFRAFIRDHELTGGIPVSGTGFDFWFAVVAPVAVAVLFLWWFGARLLARRSVTVADWVIASVALFILLYFRKFLSRADAHAFHVLAAALPLLYHALYRLVAAAESALARARPGRRGGRATPRHPVTLALLVLVVAVTPGPALGDAIARIPHSWDVAVPEDLPRLGYGASSALPVGLVEDVGLVLDAALGPDDRLFDMSNSPALFHYLLGAKPATRYYHVSMAIRRSTQRDLINELRRTLPKLVVLDAGYGLPNWDDIPNTVRHYEVSEYLLRRYRPLISVQTFLFLIPRDADAPSLAAVVPRLSQPPLTDHLLAQSRPCEWGYAPEFLSDTHHTSHAVGVSLPFTVASASAGQDVEITLPAGLRPPRFGRLEIETRGPPRADRFSLTQRPAGSRSPITFKTTGHGASRYRVRVGSCPQWHTFAGSRLSLHSGRRQDIVAVRLYR